MQKVKIILAVILLLAAVVVCLWPVIYRYYFDRETAVVVEEFRQTIPPPKPQEEVPCAELLAAIEEYNASLVGRQDALLTDPWSYEQPSFDLTEFGLESDIFGILEIPLLKLCTPIYLGATMENMSKGAAHLSNTSLPIGGMDTNSVIAGHRGYNGVDYFRHLDKLTVGDEVSFTNIWGSLHYQVTEIKIIEPSDIKKIYVQEGRDMLTLLTCHPYGSGGKQRLVIYCDRTDAADQNG